MGAQFLLLVPPVSHYVPELDAARVDLDAPVLRMDRPDDHPELYALEYRYDGQHLNSRGAERFSARVAEWLAAVIEVSGAR